MTIEYLLVKKQDDFFSTEEELLNLLKTNARIKIKDTKIQFSRSSLTYKLSKDEVPEKKEIVFHFTVSVEKEGQISKLEEFDSLLRRINSECGKQFIIDTIWDDVSTGYTRKLYPQMVEIENLLRKLIYRFMIKTVGMTWFEKAVPSEFKKAVTETAEKNNIEVTEDHLYYADFIQLCVFLFEAYSLKPKENLIRELKKAVDEKALEEKYKELIETYDPKSNWERYFAEKIEIDNLDEKWRKLYKFRNQVAHAKRMRKKECDEAIALIEELKPAFVKGLEHVNEVQLTEEETETVKVAAKEIMTVSEYASLWPRDSGIKSAGYIKVNDDGILQFMPEEKKDLFSIEGSSLYVKDGVFKVNPEITQPIYSTITRMTDKEIIPIATQISSMTLDKPLTSALVYGEKNELLKVSGKSTLPEKAKK